MFEAGNALAMTGHAGWRLAQRNIRPGDVEYVLTYGSRIHRTGATFVYLRRCDIPVSHRRTRWAKLEGTVAVVGRDGIVITVYRSRDKRAGYQAICAKARYREGGRR